MIVDEIHSLVATKRGAHLCLSLERLEALAQPEDRPLQRIGLSATGRRSRSSRACSAAEPGATAAGRRARCESVDAGAKKALEISRRSAGRGPGRDSDDVQAR